MPQTLVRRSRRFLSSALLTVLGLAIATIRADSQPAYPPCQPPLADEYLVLVVTETQERQGEVLRLLPPQLNPTICKYLDDTVTRVGGFPNAGVANQWAQYVNDNLGVPAFVAGPPGSPSAPVSSGGASGSTYNPQPLGRGYAVLVDFFNNPQVAADLRQFLRKDVGLVSYGQRPYLLAEYTTNEGKANGVLQNLSDRGFFVTLVDSRDVVLLTEAVSLQ